MPDNKLARKAGVVSLATAISRVFGLMREQTFAYFFGASMATDAFVAAFRIPNLLRDLFAEGVLSSAFVPVFTENLTNQGKEKAFRLVNLVANSLLVTVGLIVLIGIIISPLIVQLIAPGFDKIPGKSELTTTLTRIMFPFLLFIALAALVMGVLNSLGKFAVPAFAPVMLNLGMILAGFLVCPFFDPPILGMAIGAVLGSIGQFLIQYPSLKKEGYHYQWVLDFRDPELKKIFLLMTPAVLGLASTQINIFVNTLIASFLPQGSISYLNYSFRLMHFPLGVFGVAIATVSLPSLSLLAARNQTKEMLDTFYSSMRLVFFYTIPSTIFLIVASKPMVAILYQYGKFSYSDTVNTSQALVFYAIGLFAYASVRVAVSFFYSLKDAKTPVKISVVAVACNIILNLALMKPLGFKGLALATSVSAIVNLSLLLYFLNRKAGPMDFSFLKLDFVKVLLASLGMGAALWLYLDLWGLDLSQATFFLKLGQIIITFFLGAGIFIFLAKILQIEELKTVLNLFKRSLK